MRRLAAVVLLAWVLGACTPGPTMPTPTVAPSPVPTGDALRCSDAIEVIDAAPEGWTVPLGLVAVGTDRVLQTAPSVETDPAARLFAKQGLVVRIGAVVDLRVGDAGAGHARIGWGDPGTPGDHVRVDASGCPGLSTSQWAAFAGGYYVDQPRCLPIVVESGGRREVVQVPVGAACPAA